MGQLFPPCFWGFFWVGMGELALIRFNVGKRRRGRVVARARKCVGKSSCVCEKERKN